MKFVYQKTTTTTTTTTTSTYVTTDTNTISLARQWCIPVSPTF